MEGPGTVVDLCYARALPCRRRQRREVEGREVPATSGPARAVSEARSMCRSAKNKGRRIAGPCFLNRESHFKRERDWYTTGQFSTGRGSRRVLKGRGRLSAFASELRAHLLHSFAIVTAVGRHLAEVSQRELVLCQCLAVVVKGLR